MAIFVSEHSLTDWFVYDETHYYFYKPHTESYFLKERSLW